MRQFPQSLGTEHCKKPKKAMPFQSHLIEKNLPPLLGDRSPSNTEPELREIAYGVLLLPGWIFGQSERGDQHHSSPAEEPPPPPLPTEVTTSSEVKKALGLKTVSLESGEGGGGGDGAGTSEKRAVTTGELVRLQMRISERGDARVRHALLGIAPGQLGKHMESVVVLLVLELMEQLKCSDFASQNEYEAWLRENLKVLEAGLLLHPNLPLHGADASQERLQRIIHKALENPLDIGRSSESLQTFRRAVMSLGFRSSDGSAPETSHWADGFPLNLWIYQTLLVACFDIHEETYVIEEVDEVLELIKKTWVVLGINEMLHNICFLWVLFHRYVTTGQVANDLLFASSYLLEEVEKGTDEAMKATFYSETVRITLSLISSWAEKRLLAYHYAFHDGKIEAMESIVSLAVLSAKILAEYNSNRRNAGDEAGTRVKNYIRSYIKSSLRAVFDQKLEELDPSRHSSGEQNRAFPTLSALALYLTELAFSEKEIFSPKLKRWHPCAAGVAAVTLHVLYGYELKKYVKRITELTPDAIEVLLAADKLDKALVKIAVEDSIESEDGGKSIIREMQPYKAEAEIAHFVKKWIDNRVVELRESVARNLQQEANREGFAPAEVLPMIEDIRKALFSLPIPMHADLIPELMSGIDKSLQQCILKATSCYGNRNTFIPAMPALTRCSTGSKFHGLFRKKEKLQSPLRRKAQVATTSADNSFDLPRRKAQVGTTSADDSFDIPQLCVLINTLRRNRMELGVLEHRILDSNGASLGFNLSSAAAVEGIHRLSEYIAYKVVFHYLCHVLWDCLYVGDVSSTRIEPFLKELEKYLVTISSTKVINKVKTRVVIEVMRASFDGFLLVLLAGGPSRVFSLQDSTIIEEDFKSLTDLFLSNGLPAEVIQKHSSTVRAVLPLFGEDTEHIILQFTQLIKDMYGSSVKSPLPLPTTSGQWSPKEPNTLLRVLCYRKDKAASKFLKKNYNLPKKLEQMISSPANTSAVINPDNLGDVGKDNT